MQQQAAWLEDAYHLSQGEVGSIEVLEGVLGEASVERVVGEGTLAGVPCHEQ